MDRVEIRPAQASDLAGLLVLYRHLTPADPPLDQERAEAIWRELLSRSGVTVYVAVLDGDVVGTCTLVVVPNFTRGGRPYALVENVVTREDHRGRGIGQAILSAATDHAGRENCYKIMLMTSRKDEAIVRFYEKAGFSRDTKTAYEMRREAPPTFPQS